MSGRGFSPIGPTNAAPPKRETVARGPRSRFRKLRRLAKAALSLLMIESLVLTSAGSALANPTGGTVVAGSATITQPSGSVLDVYQHSNRAAIDWQSFSISSGQTTQFFQPSSSSVMLNRVVGADPSMIAGQLLANGIIVLVNPSGIVFARGSQVDVNGIVATPSDITNANFMAGKMDFNIAPTDPNASVVNNGQISIAGHGLAALVAPGVANSGIIQANLGRVVLAGAETFTVDLYGDGLLSFDVGGKVAHAPATVGGQPTSALVSNTGQISADGGTILLTADAADNVVTDLVHADGTLSATTVGTKTGSVIIDGGTSAGGKVELAGTIDVSGKGAGQVGGTAEVLGDQVTVGATASIDASGSAGGGTVMIGGNFHGAGPQSNASNTNVAQGAVIKANAITSGDGGHVVVWSNVATVFDGTIYAQGGALGGNGGSVETSSRSKLFLGTNALVNTIAPAGQAGTWLLDPTNWVIASSGGDETPGQIVAALALSNVTIQADNDITVSNAINATTNVSAVNNLTLQAGNSVAVDANIKLNGGSFTAIANDYTDIPAPANALNRAVGDGSFTMASGVSIDTSAVSGAGISISVLPTSVVNTISFTAGTIAPASLVTRGGAVSLSGATLLMSNSTINTTAGGSTGANIQFLGAIDGAFALNANAGSTGTATFDSTVGGTTALKSLAVTGSSIALDGNVTTSAGQTYTGAVAIGASDTLTTTNAAVNFTGTVDDANSAGTDSLTVAAGTGKVTFGGAVGGSQALASLGVTAGPIALDGNVTTLGSQTYSGNVTLGASDTLTTTNAAVDFGGTVSDAGTDSLTVAAGTGTVTFGGAVGNGGKTLASLGVTGGSIVLDGNVTTVGGQTYTGPVTVGANATLTTTNAAIDFTTTVDDATANTDRLTVNAGTGTVTFATTVGGTEPLLSLAATGGSIALGGNVTTQGSQTYTGPVTIGASDVLTASNAAVHFTSTVDDATANTDSLTVAAGTGTVTFGSTVGGSAPLASLSASGGSIALDGSVTTQGSQTYSGNVTLGASDVLTTTNAAVDFGGTVSDGGTDSLTVAAGTGTVTFGGAVGNGGKTLASLGVTGGSIVLDGNVTTVGGQTYTGPVTVGANATLATTNAPVDFTSTVDDATANTDRLTVNAGTGTVTFATTVGGTEPLLSLAATGGSIALGGNVTTQGSQTYTGPVTIGASDLLTTSNATVHFTSTVDDATANTDSLTVAAGTGAVTFGSTVGGSAPLASLSASGGSIALDGGVTTQGSQTYSGNVTLGASDVLTTTNAAVDFTGTVSDGGTDSLTVAAGTGTVTFGGAVGNGGKTLASLGVTGGSILLEGDVTTVGGQTYTGPVTVGGNATLTTTNAAVDFTSTVDDAAANRDRLTVNVGTGTVTFATTVGGTEPLLSLAATGGSIALGGNVTTQGSQTYTGPVTIGASDVLTTSNATVHFTSTVDGVTPNTDSLTVAAGSGAVTFGSTVGGSAPLASLSATGGTIALDGSVTTQGSQTYSGNVTLGASDVLTTTNAAVDFTGTVSDGGTDSLTVAAGTGTVTFGGAVGNGGKTLASLGVTGGSIVLDGSVTTVGGQTYTGPVTVGANATLATTNAAVDFTTTVDDATANTDRLTVNAGTGTVTFATTVGGTEPLLSLAATGGSIALGGNVTTQGSQTYTGPVTIGASDVLTTTNAAVHFTSTVDDANAAGTDSLTVAAGTGNVTFGAAVGGTASLANLGATGGTIALDGSVTTQGSQTYSGNVTLGASDVLTTTSAAVDFTGTINDTTAGTDKLTVAAGTGTVTFGGAVGGSQALASLGVTGGSILLEGNVTTVEGQTYTGPVTVGGNATLTTTNAAVDFTSTVDDAAANTDRLTVNAGTGTVTFATTVGGTEPLLSLAATGGTIALGGNVTTQGSQTYTGPVTIGASDLLTTSNATVHFTSTVDDATANMDSLTVAAGTGAVTFGSTVGGSAPLASLSASGGSIALDGSVTTQGSQTYSGNATLGASDVLTTTSAAVDFTGTINDTTAGTDKLTVAAGTGTVTFGGAVGGSQALASLGVTGGSILLEGDVTTVGGQTYTGPVTVGGNATLTTTNAAVDFTSTVDDAAANTDRLTVNAGTGTVTFATTVGGTEPLLSLAATGGTIALGGNVTTQGSQTYTGPVTIGASDVLTTTNAAVNFTSTVDDANAAGTDSLTVAAGTGNVTFGAAVGGTASLASLGATGGSIALDGSVTTQGSQTYSGNVTLGASDVLTSTGAGTIAFGGTLAGGGHSLSVVDDTAPSFAATVSGLADVTLAPYTGGSTVAVGDSSLAALGAGSTQYDFTSSGTNDGLYRLEGGALSGILTIGSSATGTITMTAFSPTLNLALLNGGGGAINVTGAYNGTGSLALTSGSGGIDLNADVTTSASQTYASPVTLSSDTTVTSTGAGTIAFDSTLAGGGHDLAVIDDLAPTFGGTVSGLNNVTLAPYTIGQTVAVGDSSLAALGTGATLYDFTTAGTNNGLYQLEGGALSGVLTIGSSTTGTITMTAFSPTLNLALLNGGGGAINVTGAYNGTGSLALTSGSGGIDLNADITTGTTQSYTGAVTISANETLATTNSAVTFSSTVDDGTATAGTDSLTINAGTGDVTFGGAVGKSKALASLTATGGSITLDGNVTTTTTQDYKGAVTLGKDADLTGSTVTFGSTVDAAAAGGESLTVTGNAVFDGIVGTTALSSLTVTGTASIDTTSITTSGTQDYDEAVTLGKDADLTGSTVTFGSTVDAAAAGGESLTVTGNAVFDGIVGTTALSSLTVTGTASIDTTSITTSGTQDYDEAVTLGKDADLTGSTVTFGATVDAAAAGGESLTVTGNAVFDGIVGTTALSSLTVTGTASIDTTSITTSGTQDYDEAVTLGKDADLTGSTVTFGSTVDAAAAGGESLTVTGNAVFDGIVGTTALSSLTVTGTASIDTTSITTSGTQDYDEAVTLGKNADLTGSTVTFGATVDAAAAGGESLTVTGNAVFDGIVGTTALSSLTVTGTASIDTTSITTSGTQDYDEAVTLGKDADLTGSTVTFGSTVDAAAAGGEDLTVTGSAAFDGAVGSSDALSSLTVTSDADLNGSRINTTGAQDYKGAVTLTSDNTLTSTAGTITFESTVDGAYGLTATASGLTTFDGAVGDTTALTSLTVTNAADLNGGSVKTSGNQDYRGAVTLTSDNTLTSTAGTISFESTVDGARELTATASGLTTFEKAVGGSTALASLIVTNAADIDGGAVTTSGTQDYQGAVTLGVDTNFTGTTVTFGSTVDAAAAGGESLTVTGSASFDGAVGSSDALSRLTVTSGADLNGLSIKTTGAQDYKGAVTLTSDNTLTSTAGTITFESTVDGAHALTATASGLTTFEKAVGGSTALTSLTVTNAADINGGAVTTSGTQDYQGAVTLGANTNLTGTTVTFGSTVDAATAGGDALTVTGNAAFDGAVGASYALSSLTVTSGADLNGGSVKTSGIQDYQGAVTLTSDDTLTSTSGAITFESTVDGAHALTATASGLTAFDGAVGGTTALASLTVTNAADLNGSSIKTSGAQDYQGVVTLTSDDTLTSTAGAITFESTVDGAHALTATASGLTTFDKAVGGTTALASLTVTNAADLNGGSVKTSGAQDYKGAVTLASDDTLTSTGGTITFESTVDGAHALTATASGLTTFDGAVGGTTALASLTVTNAADLNGAGIKTSGAQDYQGVVTLTSDDTLTSTGGTITFESTVDGAHALIATASGLTTFDGAVGGTTALASLTVTNAADLNGASIKTSGAQDYQGVVTLTSDNTLTSTSGAITFESTVDGAHALTATASGLTTFDGAVGGTTALASLTVTNAADLNGSSVTTSGAQDYQGAVTLTSDDTLTSTGGTITFESTVDGAHALTATASGLTTFDGAVGGTTALASLTVTNAADLNGGSVKTSGTQDYQSAVTLSADTNLTGTTVTFGSTVDAATAGGDALTVTGNAAFDGAVGASYALSSLTVTSGADLNGGSVKTTGVQDYQGAVTLTTDDTLTSTGGAITFESTVDGAHALTTTASGVTTFDGAVGGTTALASLTVTNAADLNGGSVKTSGAQDYQGVVTLTSDNTLTTTGGTITFESTVDGAHALTATASGLTTFEKAVGGTTALTSLTVTNASDLIGGSVTTSGTQDYQGAVTLSADTNLTGTTVTFGSTVDAATAGGEALTVTGNAAFDGTVGSTDALSSLTVTGGTDLNGGSVKTTGAQDYQGAVTLTSDDTLTSTGGTITFEGTVDGAHALTATASGLTTFDGAVGGTTALASLTVTNAADLNGASIKTSGAQDYQGVVTLTSDSTLTSTSGTITFEGTVDGAHALTATASGLTTFDKAVGGTTALASLTVTNAADLNGSSVTTSGAQDYKGAVTLTSDDTLTSTGGTITFESTVDGAHALTATASGLTTFDGAVGGTTALASLTVTNAADLNGGSVKTSGAQDYQGVVTLTSDNTLTTTGGTITFESTVDGAHALTATASGLTTFEKAVGGTTALTSLTVTNASDLIGGSVTTSGTQDYQGAVTLSADTNLTGPTVTFGSTVDAATAGGEFLTVTGNAAFDGTVGSTDALSSLTVTGGTDLNGGSVKTTGAQDYQGAVTLTSDDTLTSTGGTITFESTVDGAHALTATASGLTTFDGAVGGTTALASLTVTNAADLNGASIKTSGAQDYKSTVTLTADDTLTSTAGAITFESTVDGVTADTESLTVNAPAGEVTFGGAVGGTNALAGLSVSADTLNLDGNVTVSGGIAFKVTGDIELSTTLSAGGDVLLSSSNGVVAESAATGIVDAPNLLVLASGTIDLQSDNAVGTIAMQSTQGGIAYHGAAGFTVGSIDDLAAGASFDGVAASGDVALVAGNGGTTIAQNTLSLAAGVDVGSSNLLLETQAGANPGGNITQTSGIVTASGLALESVGSIDMPSLNAITTLASSSVGGIAFQNGAGFTVGTVTVANAPSLNLAAPLSGVTAGGDSALVANGGDLVLAGNVNVGTNNLLLQTKTSGEICEAGGPCGTGMGGIVTASGLALQSAGSIDMPSLNAVTTLAASATNGIAFQNGAGFAVASATAPVVVNSPSLGVTLSDVAAGGDSALVANGGDLVSAGNVNVGTNNLLLQTKTSGEICEAGGPCGTGTGGIVTASGLALQSAGSIDMPSLNAVTTLAASATNGIAFQNGAGFTVASATAPVVVNSPSLGTTLSDVAAGGDTALVANGGDLVLAGNVNVGTNNLLLQTKTSGEICEAGGPCGTGTGGKVTASGLALESAGSIDMQSLNVVTTLAASAAGGIAFQNGAGFTVASSTAPVVVSSPSLGTTLNDVAAGGDTALVANGGALVLAGNVNIGTNNLLLQTKTSGEICKAGGPCGTGTGGKVTASGLALESAGSIDMQSLNAVTTMAASATGGIAFQNGAGFTVASSTAPVVVSSPSLGTTLSDVAAGGDTALVANGGDLVLAGNVNVGTNNLLLQTKTSGEICEAGGPCGTGTGGIVTASGLALLSSGSIDMQSLNAVTTLAASATGGIAFRNGAGFTVGAVTVAPPSPGIGLSGISAGGYAALSAADGTLSVASGTSLATTGGNIALGGSGIAIGSGVSVTAPAIVLDTTGLTSSQLVTVASTAGLTASSINTLAQGPGTNANQSITIGSLNAPGSVLLISAGHGEVSGTVTVKALGISGVGGGSALTGSIDGTSGAAAAIFGVRKSGADNDYRFNGCAISSPSCNVLPLFVPLLPQIINTIEFGTQQQDLDPFDIERLNTGNEDEL